MEELLVVLLMISTISTAEQDDPLPPCAVSRLGTTRFRAPPWFKRVRLSRDRRVLVALGSKQLAVLDADSGRRMNCFEPAADPSLSSYDICYMPDGGQLISSASDGSITFWSTSTWQVVRRLQLAEKGLVTKIAVTGDGKMLGAVISRTGISGSLELWDIERGERLRHVVSHRYGISDITFSPDSQQIAVIHGHDRVNVYNCASARLLGSINKPEDASYIESLAFSPNGNTVAIGFYGGDWNSIYLWNPARAKEGKAPVQDILELIGHDSAVNVLAYRLDGKLLASAGPDQTIRLWDGESGESLATLAGHRAPIESIEFSRDGHWLVSADDASIIRIWDVAKRAPRDAFGPNEGPVASVAFSPDGSAIASGGEDRTMRLWNAATGKPKTVAEHGDYQVAQVAFSSDGTLVFSADGDKVWPCESPHEIRAYDQESGELQFSLSCGPEKINGLALSDDGRLLASSSNDKLVRIWDLSTRKAVWEFEPPVNYRPSSIALSIRGEIIAIAGHDDTIQLWSLKERRRIRNLEQHWDPVYALTFSPDGDRLVSASRDSTARVWHVETGRQIYCLGQPTLSVLSGERPVKPEILRLNGHHNAVSCVTCSCDGKLIATGSWDCTVRLWSMTSGDHLVTFSGHEGSVNSVAFSPDSRRLVSASSDTTMLIWDVEAALTKNESK